MTTKQFEIEQVMRRMDRGVWFTLGVIASRANCSKQTVRKFAKLWVMDGWLITSETVYNNNVKQTLYMIPVVKDAPQQMDMFEGVFA